MNLRDLALAAGIAIPNPGSEIEVGQITMDSRKVRPGALFVCTPGMTTDSHFYLADAAARGAVAAVTHSERGKAMAQSSGLAVVALAEERPLFNAAIVRMCEAFYRGPSDQLAMVGVTGTNGKTTTAWLIRDLLQAMGFSAGYLGTLGYQRPGHSVELSNTTPFPTELFELLADARDAGVQHLAMEVSSHALAENRVLSEMFKVGVFTNLTQDHLDFHLTMENYEAAKYRLFEPSENRALAIRSVINVDDAIGERWARNGNFVPWEVESEDRSRLVRTGSHGDLRAENTVVAVDRIEFDLVGGGVTHRIVAPLGSSFNVENLLSAIAAVFSLGYPLDRIAAACPLVRPVPGRFEPVPNEHGIGVLIDYAHTPDALTKLLKAVRTLSAGRVITVFGCGGDRDRLKRPLMAQAASAGSDFTVVTSDNPRTEDPSVIIADVMKGVEAGREARSIIDRRSAIEFAIDLAEPGDVVVLAGKGHEEYQIIGREKIPLSDRICAQDALARKG